MENRFRILFVDDERALRLLACRMLQDKYEVSTAASAFEALSMTAAGDYDLVITDCEMPGMTGIDLIATVRGRKPDARCLVASGNLDDRRVAWLQKERVPFIHKPWRVREFLDLVAETLTGPK